MLTESSVLVLDAGFDPEDVEGAMICCSTSFGPFR